jgi:two-component system nitrate/nitrite response regulator NarL
MITNEPKIRVLICSRYTLFREGIKALLGHWDGIEVVGDAPTAKRMLRMAGRLHPDVVLVDAAGCDTIRRMKELDSHIKVLILSPSDDERLESDGLSAGASGYIRKDVQSEQLKRAIQNVCRGSTFAA